MLKKITNVTAVISTSVMIIYFLFSWISFGSEITQRTMPVTDLAAILTISLLCAVGTIVIRKSNDENISRREYIIRCVVHIIFLTAVVMTGGYILGWYTLSVSGVVLMLLSIAFVYAVTFFSQYFKVRKTADEVNKKIKERMNGQMSD